MSRTPDNTTSSTEVPRKVLHLLVAVFPVVALQLGRPLVLAICTPIAVLAVSADVFRGRNEAFESFIQRWFGFMMRQSERAEDGRVVINGATWVLVSFVLVVLLFPLRLSAAGFFLFIIGDAFAALFGQRFGRHRWPGSTRTIEGTTAFIISGVLAASIFPGLTPVSCIPAVVLGAAAEVLPGPLNDNVRVPIVIAAALFTLEIAGMT